MVRDVSKVVSCVLAVRITLPGRFHELNIHYGVFLGGMGDFTEVFLGLLDNFRGCMDQVSTQLYLLRLIVCITFANNTTIMLIGTCDIQYVPTLAMLKYSQV